MTRRPRDWLLRLIACSGARRLRRSILAIRSPRDTPGMAPDFSSLRFFSSLGVVGIVYLGCAWMLRIPELSESRSSCPTHSTTASPRPPAVDQPSRWSRIIWSGGRRLYSATGIERTYDTGEWATTLQRTPRRFATSRSSRTSITEIDPRRSAAGTDEYGLPARDESPAPRLDGSRAGKGHHDQGARSAHELHGAGWSRRTSST